ncbi:PREDICTED: cytochrome P450 4d2-like [Rhagoletis zephyria]|uniref:cytochrome P450 4d2-like n=1 Tax=Rhagoletis zephyria TaxID=28612 RepID=UPI000811846D|nr:PREDICTED: cytochrome P450 4d2-like [Rhagoletis zephyria]XP_036339074.1 cytochrome P450 4d2-like [Rhagoletis pomonella]
MMWFSLLLVLSVLCMFADYLWKRDVNFKWSKLPGPLNLPILGSIWIYTRVQPDELISLSRYIRNRFGRVARFWVLHIHAMFVCDLRFAQTLLSHPTEIRKNRMYSLLNDWLGDGLLVSYGAKWQSRRRVITPTFHFSILEDFVRIFDQQAQILVGKLEKSADGVQIVDIQNPVALATLDVICESAMGVRTNAQTDEGCEYVHLLTEMIHIILKRYVTLVYRPNWLFQLLAPRLAKRHITVTAALHAFTERIIRQRREEMLKQQAEIDKQQLARNDEFGIKRRQALLDVLLSATVDGHSLTDVDIREEVDTFMFEGHDTTKSAIAFALYCISRNTDVQFKLYAEIVEVLGTSAQQAITQSQLMQLKYTEQVIKEALRMYPPVPYIGRTLMEDCYIHGNCIPKGTSVLLAIYEIQNDADYFPEPHKFMPERQANENPFAFVPFSAGPRNCIGQRFALLEMKTFIARIVQVYELLSLGADVVPTVRVVLESKTGWQMGFRKRKLIA